MKALNVLGVSDVTFLWKRSTTRGGEIALLLISGAFTAILGIWLIATL